LVLAASGGLLLLWWEPRSSWPCWSTGSNIYASPCLILYGFYGFILLDI
jgi:hypothetical protein